jgi:cobalt/nickel transport protein
MKNSKFKIQNLRFIYLIGIIIFPLNCFAHFGMIIPSTDVVESQKQANLTLKVMFTHPFEGHTMDMARPLHFGVYFQGKKHDLTSKLESLLAKHYNDDKSYQAWQLNYKIKRPGDYIFYLEPQPYWEPAEDCFIVHYTKVIVDGFGQERGWDKAVGLKTEIIPLTRPYGLYTGNIFCGKVLVEGKPAPFTEVEVEYYNEGGSFSPPTTSHITQVIKCDENAIFSYAMPKAGWWGFAALNEDKDTIKYQGQEKPVEIGAVIWVKVYDMK